MSLTFPTTPTRHAEPGTPQRAEPCACDERQLLDPHSDECVRCGRYDATTINKTWADRAQRIARRRKAAR